MAIFYKGRTKGEWQTARVGSETKAGHKRWQLVYLPVYSHTCVMHPAFCLFDVLYIYIANLKFSLQVARSVCAKKKYSPPRKHNIMYPPKSSSKWWTKTIVVFTSIYHIYPNLFHPPSPGTGFLRIGQRSSFAGDLWFDIPGTKLGDGRWKQSRWSNGM